MIDWTDELMAQVGQYSRGALSYPGEDGYPVALPLPFTFFIARSNGSESQATRFSLRERSSVTFCFVVVSYIDPTMIYVAF